MTPTVWPGIKRWVVAAFMLTGMASDLDRRPSCIPHLDPLMLNRGKIDFVRRISDSKNYGIANAINANAR